MSIDPFNSGVPPSLLYRTEVEQLDELVNDSVDVDYGLEGISNKAAEVCLIGLASYFEAFCKNQFAAIVNMCPAILEQFCRNRKEVKIDLTSVVAVLPRLDESLGFILSEQYDFGSAKTMNALFHDLLGVTPLTANDVKKYSRFLADRNLLVHHGGVYTYKYVRHTLQGSRERRAPYFDSIVVSKDVYLEWSQFITELAKKIADSTYRGLRDYAARYDLELLDDDSVRLLDWV